PRPARRGRPARVGRRHELVPDGAPQGAVRRAAAARRRPRRPPVDRRRRGRRDTTSAGRGGQPVEPGQGPVVRAAAPRARGRGALRPHGGHALPAHGPARALAPRPLPGVLHVRPARGARPLRPERGPRRVTPAQLTHLPRRPTTSAPPTHLSAPGPFDGSPDLRATRTLEDPWKARTPGDVPTVGAPVVRRGAPRRGTPVMAGPWRPPTGPGGAPA